MIIPLPNPVLPIYKILTGTGGGKPNNDEEPLVKAGLQF